MRRAPANRQMNTALEMAAAAAMSDDPASSADAAMDSGDHKSHLRLSSSQSLARGRRMCSYCRGPAMGTTVCSTVPGPSLCSH
eukprot:8688065-Lingulodinium_polyedra.AAC.1